LFSFHQGHCFDEKNQGSDGYRLPGYPKVYEFKSGDVGSSPKLSSSGSFNLVQKAFFPGFVNSSYNNSGPVDFDHDGKLEFVCTDNGMWAQNVKIYECSGDNIFTPVATTCTFSSSIYIADVTDIDRDGLLDLIVFGTSRTSDYWIRVYEQKDSVSYPVDPAFEVVPFGNEWASGVRIADLDKDNAQEIIYSTQGNNGGYFAVLECSGDNTFTKVYSDSTKLETQCGVQAFTCGLDTDEDGLQEILIGGYPKLCLYENDSNNAYHRFWEYKFGNVLKLINTGDIDKNNLPDFLSIIGTEFTRFERNVSGICMPVWSENLGNGAFSESDAIMCDLDQDGCKEIAVQLTNDKYVSTCVYKFAGNNVVTPVWSRLTALPQPPLYYVYPGLAECDLDKDGKKELLFNDYVSSSNDVNTVVFEYEGMTSIKQNVQKMPGCKVRDISITQHQKKVTIYRDDDYSGTIQSDIFDLNGRKIKSFLTIKKSVDWDGKGENGNKVGVACYIASVRIDRQVFTKSFIFR
jgi:hypothetical protein